MPTLARRWRRREPQDTVLYQTLAAHLETFLARLEDDDTRPPLPRFVVRELHDFLKCGILVHGFCRVHCDTCGKDELVAFSCKHRGFCPACGTRRMADTAAWLVDRVFPEVPVRQWVLALPYPVRFLCAFDPPTARGVRRIFVRAVSGLYGKDACRRGIEKTKAAAVVFEQRFDQALRLNLHYHGLWVDGTFACSLGKPDADFHPIADVTDADVERLVRAIRTRVLRFLHRTGKLTEEHTVDHEGLDPSTHHLLGAAAVQGRIALGPHAGAPVHRLGQGSQPMRDFRRGPLCAAVDGFSLHAAVRVPAGAKERLEKLCRYAARPPIVHERLSLTPDGKVLYKFKRTFRDGSSHVVLDPLTFVGRLAALVPRPRVHLVTYHGMFAPAAPLRDRVVPPPPEDEVAQATPKSAPAPAPCPHQPLPPTATRKPPAHKRHRYSWAELLRRVFHIEVFLCDCGGQRRLLAAILEPEPIRRILLHLGLPADPPPVAPARAPPGVALPWA